MNSKKATIYLFLSGVFITNAIVAELIGGKLIYIGPYLMSIGILPWPIVFITTDLINEYFGKQGVKKVTLLTSLLIIYTFLLLFLALQIPSAIGVGFLTDAQFTAVFGQSLWIIIGSLTAFVASQIIDMSLFHFFKNKTGQKYIWLRSTGSTVISQFFDSFIVLGIAFWATGKISFQEYIQSAFTGYFVKIAIAICMTPIIYLAHYAIDSYLKKD